MDISSLRIFLKVYEYCSMTKAAEDLYTSPQNISKNIIKLENFLDVYLFERTSSGLLPTNEAHKLKLKAQSIIKDFDNLKHFCSSDLIPDQKKIIKIGSITGVFRYLTFDFITDFYQKHPQIKLEIIEQTVNNVNELLWNEIIDIAFNSPPINFLKYDAHFFSSHKYCAVMNKKHPLCSEKTLLPEHLATYPIVIERCFYYYLNTINQLGITPDILYETMDITYPINIAKKTNALGICVDFLAIDAADDEVEIKCFSDPLCRLDCYLLTKKDRPIKPEVSVFSEFALNWIKKIMIN